MKCTLFIIFLSLLLLPALNSTAQTKKFDTTVKWGDQGFHVVSSNKETDQNKVSVTPINIRLSISNPSFNVAGKLTKALVDDFNDDGRPDLALCVFSGDSLQTGSIIGVSVNGDKGLDPIYFDDIYLDPKNRDGYKGHDEFSSLTGTLIRKFPVYLPNDTLDKPTGGIRTIQYKAMQDNGRLKFKILRTFDVK